MSNWPLWMQVTELCWSVMWSAFRVFAVCAAAPAGVLFGLRVLRAIRPVVTP